MLQIGPSQETELAQALLVRRTCEFMVENPVAGAKSATRTDLQLRVTQFCAHASDLGISTARGTFQFVWLSFATNGSFGSRPEVLALIRRPENAPDAWMDMLFDQVGNLATGE